MQLGEPAETDEPGNQALDDKPVQPVPPVHPSPLCSSLQGCLWPTGGSMGVPVDGGPPCRGLSVPQQGERVLIYVSQRSA